MPEFPNITPFFGVRAALIGQNSTNKKMPPSLAADT